MIALANGMRQCRGIFRVRRRRDISKRPARRPPEGQAKQQRHNDPQAQNYQERCCHSVVIRFIVIRLIRSNPPSEPAWSAPLILLISPPLLPEEESYDRSEERRVGKEC